MSSEDEIDIVSPSEELIIPLFYQSTLTTVHTMPKLKISNKNKTPPKWQDDIVGLSILMLLYCLQGIPLGLIFGSLPFVMAEKLSYTDQATFSLSAYPYSLKLLWSPIVDVFYSPKWGRRKSWIFPMQSLMGLTMIYISFHFDKWSGSTPDVITLTCWFFWLIFLTATQDIAVDGWALTILSEGNREMQAMCQTVGQTFGYALGFPVFLALNSPEICTKWFGSSQELVTASSFLMICGVVILITNALIALFISERSPTKDEERELDQLSIKSTYLDIIRVIRIPNVFKLIVVLLTCRIAFSCVDSVTSLKLNEKGFPKETAGLLVFVYVPFELIFPFVIAYINTQYLGYTRMQLWQNGFGLRIVASIAVISLLYAFELDEDGHVPYWFLFKQIITAICYSFTSSMMFTSQCGFFAKIADETIGGTYLTLLNTVSNLGNTWPRYFVLRSVDLLTVKHEIQCIDKAIDGKPCFETETDGYYLVATVCALFGIGWMLYSSRTLNSFDNIPKQLWTVKRAKIDID
eukprot:252533_1